MENNRTEAFAIIEQISPGKRQALLISSLLLQRFTVLKTDENFFDNLSDSQLTHSDFIAYATAKADFTDTREYFHFRNEVFYVDSLLENVELDVAVNMIMKNSKGYSQYNRENLVEHIINHPKAIDARNENLGLLMKVTIPLRERKFMEYIKKITDVDFKEEVTVAASNIHRHFNKNSAYFKTKAGLIFNYAVDYLNDEGVQKMLVEDPYHITKYLLATTSSILMEDLHFTSKEGLGIFNAPQDTSTLNYLKLGLDDENENNDVQISIKHTPAYMIPESTSAIDDIDNLLKSLKG